MLPDEPPPIGGSSVADSSVAGLCEAGCGTFGHAEPASQRPAPEEPTMTRVFLLRHAESADPTVFHGAESDVGLSERGERQAHAVAAVLAAHRPTAVVSSAMRRAV